MMVMIIPTSECWDETCIKEAVESPIQILSSSSSTTQHIASLELDVLLPPFLVISFLFCFSLFVSTLWSTVYLYFST